MTTANGVYTHLYDPSDPRLGRHVRHDARNLRYAAGVLPKSAITTVRWQRRIPIMDQGQLGSCTGNALASVLGTDSAGRTAPTVVTVTAADKWKVFTPGTYGLDESVAVKLYSVNTREDTYSGSYPPSDTGSDGPAAGATGKALGLLTGYQHAFSMDALVSALQFGPVMWGTVWLNSMFDTDSNGVVKVDRKSGEAGGHELCISGYDTATSEFNIDNSWGPDDFGIAGSGLVKSSDMSWLLSQDGDITVPQYVTAPAPTPVPDPTPTPDPVPPAVVDDATLWATAKAWAAANGLV
jgi:hypothetical protein